MKPQTLLIAPLLLASSLLAQGAGTPPAAARPQYPDPVWLGTFDEAVQRARTIKDGRILVELRDAKCPGCERMATLVYPSVSFGAFMRDKVAVRVDRDTPEGQKLVARFRVRVSPAWLVLTPDLLLCGRQEGESNQSTWFERALAAEKGWGAFLRLLEAERKAPSDPAAVFAVAEEAFRRFGDAMAEERFRRVGYDEKATPVLREKSLTYLATMALETRRFDDAEKALNAILALSKDAALRERAELRLADVEIGRGQRDMASARLKAFLASHPASPNRKQVEELLKALAAPKP